MPIPLTLTLTLAATLALLFAPIAMAEDFGRRGFYVGAGGLGGSYTRFDDELEDQLRSGGASVSVETDAAGGFEVYAGYRVHPHFAIESEFEMLTKADIAIDGLGTLATLESWSLTGNLKAFASSGSVQPFALIGLGAMETELEDEVGLGSSVSQSGLAARFGLGIDFYVTAHVVFSIGVDYLLPTGDLEYLDYVSYGGGLQYRF